MPAVIDKAGPATGLFEAAGPRRIRRDPRDAMLHQQGGGRRRRPARVAWLAHDGARMPGTQQFEEAADAAGVEGVRRRELQQQP